MLKNCLVTAWQNLLRQKLFALINVLGLAIGLAVFILIFLYVKKEYSWDRHWENADRLHWLTFEYRINQTNAFRNPFSPAPTAQMVQDNFPEAIERTARLLQQGSTISVGEEAFPGFVYFADASLLDILDLYVVSGSLENVFANPGQIALTENLKETYFGKSDALGQVITLNVQEPVLRPGPPSMLELDFEVGAVYRVPEETSMFLGNLALLDESTLPGMNAKLQDWQGFIRIMNLYLLKAESDIAAMNARLPGLVDSLVPKEPWRFLESGQTMSDFHDYRFQHLPDAHFDDSLSTPRKGSVAKITVFFSIGLIVLAMGSINFVILETAKADDRKKEVGVRKVLGARKWQLVGQFMGESVAYTLVSLVLALGLAAATLPAFSTLINLDMGLELITPASVVQLSLIALVVGCLAGLYPALVMSGFSPVSVFRTTRISVATRAFNVRNVLAFLQFSVTIALVVATAVLYLQLNYIRTQEPGYRTENLFTFSVFGQVMNLVTPLANELQGLPGVEQVALSSRRPGYNGVAMTTFSSFTNDLKNLEAEWTGVMVDHRFFDIYQIPTLAGRTYDLALDMAQDASGTPGGDMQRRRRVVINRPMALALGFASPAEAIGQQVSRSFTNAQGEEQKYFNEVIGVVEDSRFDSLNTSSENKAYFLQQNNLPVITVAFQDARLNDIQSEVEAVWNKLDGGNFYRSAFVEEALLEEFTQEENEGRLLMTFSGLAIFIACMGLYGIAAYGVKKGVKEVGIRKVLGATSGQVLRLFLWRFSLPVLVASVLAWPTAVLIMLRWLQRFNEQIDYLLLVPICLLSTLLALLIAWLTVSATTLRAARANPVRSLRYE